MTNHLKDGSTKMCLRAVLGTRSFTGLKAIVWLGEDVGSPSPPYLQLQRERDCWIAFCMHGGCSGRTGHIQSRCVCQECCEKSWLSPGAGGRWRCRHLAAPCPYQSTALPGVQLHGDCISPQLLGWTGMAPFQCSPLGHIPLQPWLSTSAIPTSLAPSFSGCFHMQTPPFTLDSLNIPFSPLFLQPGKQGRSSVLPG